MESREKGWCWMKLSVGGDPVPRRVVFELFWREAPRASANFFALCRGGHRGAGGGATGLGYQGSSFHRVIPAFLLQGGDITHGDGTGGESIFGGPFEDEKYLRTHSGSGLLGLANWGKDTNTSQFYVTLAPAPHLNERNVVFGRVAAGMEVLRLIENTVQTSFDDVPEPHCRVVVESCGVLEEYAGEDTASQPFPECPQDNHPPLGIDALLESAERLKTEFGNKRFQANRYGDASGYYLTAVRYLKHAASLLEEKAGRGGEGAAPPAPGDRMAAVAAAKLAVYTNLSVCHGKVGDWVGSRRYAREALKFNADHPKALYRFAEAVFRLGGDVDTAWDAAKRCAKLAAHDKLCAELLSEIGDARKTKMKKLSNAMGRWTSDLEVKGKCIEFEDRRSRKRVTVFPMSGGGVSYRIGTNERDRIRQAVVDKAAGSVSFPEIRRTLSLPADNGAALIGQLTEFFAENGVDVTMA
ncbi:Peptidyl-prolyl cis-trans isomerase D [Diplonema papillatum]|nr:Peptidyl-prolyl cis-trans isomerase D [Diplonema papillatum]